MTMSRIRFEIVVVTIDTSKFAVQCPRSRGSASLTDYVWKAEEIVALLGT